VSVILW